MCTVSMIGDHFNEKWNQPNYQQIFTNIPEITKAEFDALKKEVEEMKALLKRAKIYDKQNGEPNCELNEKIEMLEKIAEIVGLNLEDIFEKKD